ncbi:MAG: hypothetical protein MUC96_21285 [Myxococcaceae bacterium]|jgi:hypothetical protein|nr:hypothetical protein [Myxococcaceae bacterium]
MMSTLLALALTAAPTVDVWLSGTSVGFAPALGGVGGGAQVALVPVRTKHLALLTGVRLQLDATSTFGGLVSPLAVTELRWAPHARLWLGLGLSAGAAVLVPTAPGFDFDEGNARRAATRLTASFRATVSLSVGTQVAAGPLDLAPAIRLDQSLLVGFATMGGIPLLPLSSLSLVVGFTPREIP